MLLQDARSALLVLPATAAAERIVTRPQLCACSSAAKLPLPFVSVGVMCVSVREQKRLKLPWMLNASLGFFCLLNSFGDHLSLKKVVSDFD